jgi:hypothetical protein
VLGLRNHVDGPRQITQAEMARNLVSGLRWAVSWPKKP